MAETWTNEQDFHWQNDFDPYGKSQSGGVGTGGDDNGGGGLGALVKLVLIGFVLSGLSGVFQRLSDFGDMLPDISEIAGTKGSTGNSGSDPDSPVTRQVHYLTTMLPQVGFDAARRRIPQAALTVVTIENNSQNRLGIYRLKGQYEETTPRPLIREATVDRLSSLEIVCHVDEVFVVAQENSRNIFYVAAESEPGTWPIW